MKQIVLLLATMLLMSCSSDCDTMMQDDFTCLWAAAVVIQNEDRLVFAVISDTHVGNYSGAGYGVKVPQALRHLTGHGKSERRNGSKKCFRVFTV